MTKEELSNLLQPYAEGSNLGGLFPRVKIFEKIWAAINQKGPEPEPAKLFSGDASRGMWEQINELQYKKLKDVLYTICCKMQELEAKVDGNRDKQRWPDIR